MPEQLTLTSSNRPLVSLNIAHCSMASTTLPHQGCVHVSSSCQARPTVRRSVISNFSRPISSNVISSTPTAAQRCGGKTSGALLPTTSRGCACRSSEELFSLAATAPGGVQVWNLFVDGDTPGNKCNVTTGCAGSGFAAHLGAISLGIFHGTTMRGKTFSRQV